MKDEEATDKDLITNNYLISGVFYIALLLMFFSFIDFLERSFVG
jgi:hypothetical protein